MGPPGQTSANQSWSGPMLATGLASTAECPSTQVLTAWSWGLLMLGSLQQASFLLWGPPEVPVLGSSGRQYPQGQLLPASRTTHASSFSCRLFGFSFCCLLPPGSARVSPGGLRGPHGIRGQKLSEAPAALPQGARAIARGHSQPLPSSYAPRGDPTPSVHHVLPSPLGPERPKSPRATLSGGRTSSRKLPGQLPSAARPVSCPLCAWQRLVCSEASRLLPVLGTLGAGRSCGLHSLSLDTAGQRPRDRPE